jgi:hypothetical protein
MYPLGLCSVFSVILFAVYTVIAAVRRRVWRRRRRGQCVECGYNLAGLPEPRCPECGTSI